MMQKKLTKEQLDYFRKLLNHQLKELQGKIGEVVNELSEDSKVIPDISDRATKEADLNFGLRVQDREQKLIEKIKQALKRIDDGSFGICESCEEMIDIKRLKARPVTTLCIDCKLEQEKDERSRGE